MNGKSLLPCFLLVGTLLLGSCENGQPADRGEQGTELPDGNYPLAFTATVQAVSELPSQTRVSDSEGGGTHKSSWDGGEVVNVRIADGEVGVYTLDEYGNATAQSPCYWQDNSPAIITAWYSNIEGQATETNKGRIVSLSEQSDQGLAYVLKATATSVDYNSTVALNFEHRLAKVRVKLTGEKETSVNRVEVNGYTSCTVTDGDVSGSSEEYIPMRQNGEYYEANLVPMDIKQEGFIRLNEDVQAKVTGINRLEAGRVYTITIDVAKVSFIIDGGDVLIKGYEGTEPIVVNKDATITIEDVKLTTSETTMTINNGANVTLNVKGTNIFTSSDGAGIKIMETTNSNKKGSITINGTGASSSKLEIEAAVGAAIGFRMVDSNAATDIISCGNIEINDIELVVRGGRGSPAIGISALENDLQDSEKKYGTISINRSTVEAYSSGGAACIGTPYHNSASTFFLKGIFIEKSNVTAIAEGDQAACIGFGYTAKGGIFKKGIQKIAFNETSLTLTTGATYGVGFGDGDPSRTKELPGGIWKDGDTVGDVTGWNPD